MLISVAVCTYQRYHRLRDSIVSLRGLAFDPRDFEILIVDNSPDAEQSRREAESWPGTRWIHTTPPGLARARNVAVAEARAPLLAFIDDDVAVPPGWLAAIVAGFAQFGDEAHMVGGPVRPAWSSPRPAWLADGMLPYLSLIDRGPAARLLDPAEWLAGANVAYRRDRVREAGGFAVALGRNGASLMSNEEGELAQRMRQAGGLAAWLPAAGVIHHIDSERLDLGWFRRRAAWQAVSDAIADPAHPVRMSGEAWVQVAGYLAQMAPAAALPALAATQTRPDLAHWEVTAIYHLVLGLLGGLQQPPNPELISSDPSP